MKKCPFCAEEIMDEANKCKHCNEWIVNDNSVLNFLKSAKNTIASKLSDSNTNKPEKFELPTFHVPMKIRGLDIFSNRLEFDNTIIPFEKIETVIFRASISTQNFRTTEFVSLTIIGKFNNEENNSTILLAETYRKNVIGNNLTRKEFEKIVLLNSFLSTSTFNNRLNFYLKALESLGHFHYKGYFFYKNGDIKKYADKVITNLKDEVANQTIRLGSAWAGLKSSNENPFEFVINSGVPKMRIFGIETGNKLKIETVINHDVFTSLIKYFVDNKEFPAL